MRPDIRMLGAVALAALLATACNRQQEPKPPSPPAALEPELGAAWLRAVAAADQAQALRLAAGICGPVESVAVGAELTALCRKNGVSERFINAPFNALDAMYWEGLLAVKRSADRCLAGVPAEASDADRLKALFSMVRESVESIPIDTALIPWPWVVKDEGRGVCDRQAWLLCELAGQSGFDAQIVYLVAQDGVTSPHTICELRKDGDVWVADPLSGLLRQGLSLGDLATQPNVAAELWPQYPEWQDAITRGHYFLPAYPQDFCLRNQVLQNKLRTVLGNTCPSFGQPPRERMDRYVSAMTAADRKRPRAFWFYPFRLLRDEIRKRRTGRE